MRLGRPGSQLTPGWRSSRPARKESRSGFGSGSRRVASVLPGPSRPSARGPSPSANDGHGLPWPLPRGTLSLVATCRSPAHSALLRRPLPLHGVPAVPPGIVAPEPAGTGLRRGCSTPPRWGTGARRLQTGFDEVMGREGQEMCKRCLPEGAVPENAPAALRQAPAPQRGRPKGALRRQARLHSWRSGMPSEARSGPGSELRARPASSP